MPTTLVRNSRFFFIVIDWPKAFSAVLGQPTDTSKSALLDAGHGDSRAMGSVGYAEAHAHLRGELSRDELRDAIVRATRVFARRQRTWLNHAEVMWF